MGRWKTRLRRFWGRKMGAPKKKRLPWVLLLSIAAFALLLLWIQVHMRPLLVQKAEVQVDYIAVKAINEAIGAKLAEDDIEYGSIVYFEKDIYGQITALQTNMISVNRLKTEIMNEVLEALHRIKSSEMGIPLGNLFSGELLSGRGPDIPVRIVPLGMVDASFSNVFSAAGINQTRHQVMMNIVVDMSILLPGSHVEKQVTTQVCIAETIIVGSVPDSYLQFDSDLFKE